METQFASSCADLSETEAPDPSSRFFCVLTKGAPWWQPLKKLSTDKSVDDILEPVAAQYASSLQHERASHPPLAPPLLLQTKKYVFSAGGAVVCPAVVPVTSELLHVSPYVQHEDEAQRLVVFQGWLSNLGDLIEGDCDLMQRNKNSGSGTKTWLAGGAQHTDSKGEHTAYLTTQALLHLYDKLGQGQEMLMLSELQGQFAFLVLDASKRVVFAARDASGEEELFWAQDTEDGATLFTNSIASLPKDMARQPWQALPPGHYMAGKDPIPVQYALSRAELAARERRESCVNGALDDAHVDVRGSCDGQADDRVSPAATLIRRLSRPFVF